MSPPLVVATVTGRTTEELLRRRREVAAADLIELRLDGVQDLDVAAALAGCAAPVIVTCRPRWEGGAFSGSEHERRAILAEALEGGAAYVDIEWRAGFDDLIRARRGRNIVLSMHDFTGVPPDLSDRLAAMRATGAELVKVAVYTASLRDTLRLLELGGRRSSGMVLVGMGDAGLATRILAGRFGSCWTYAGDSAPGQIALSRLLGQFRFRQIGPGTTVYAVVGAPIGHSLSPAMHNACFAALGVDAVDVPLQAASAGDFLAFAEAIGLTGASVTAPFKVELAARVSQLDAVARRLGAINTMARTADGWAGINTDVAGFLAPLAGRVDLERCRAAILGAGGAARAVAAALGDAGAAVSVFARDPVRARAVAALGGGAGFAGHPAPGSWDLLVNATPVGAFPRVDETPLPAGELRGGLVYDLVYNPGDTRLLREAAAAGCETIGGLDMLVAQAERQAAWWMGRPIPRGVMRRAAVAALGTSPGEGES